VKFRCPCVNCLNKRKLNATTSREYLSCDGFLRSCTTWIWHDKLIDFPTVPRIENVVNSTVEDLLEEDKLNDMIRDVGTKAFVQVHVHETMSTDVETSLYVGSIKFTRLLMVLRLMNLKATNWWTDKSFIKLLVLLNEMLPNENTLPTCNYDAKSILSLMDMEYKMIYACFNDCILLLQQNCSFARKINVKIYFSLISRFLTRGDKNIPFISVYK